MLLRMEILSLFPEKTLIEATLCLSQASILSLRVVGLAVEARREEDWSENEVLEELGRWRWCRCLYLGNSREFEQFEQRAIHFWPKAREIF